MKLWKRYLILVAVCICAGIITGSLFRGSYFDALLQIMDSFENNIVNQALYMGSSEKIFLLIKVIVKRATPFALMWLLTVSVFGRPYIVWLCASRGFICGFWCCFIAMAYGSTAAKLIPLWYSPHALFYAAAYGISILYIAENLKQRKLVLITLLAVVLLAGCILETYVNPLCLKWVWV